MYLHALVENGTLSNDAVLSVIRTTCEVKTEFSVLSGETNGRTHESLNLLRAVFDSFTSDTA